jgi:hypothetical protein
MAASDNLNQAQFDKKFKEIALTETALGAIKKRQENFDNMGPIKTQVAAQCNNEECDKEVEANAVYHPSDNTMYWKCPHCGEDDQMSNWHDTNLAGQIHHYDTGKEIKTPQQLRDTFSEPDPSKPPVPDHLL